MKKIAPFLLGLPLGLQLFACTTAAKTDNSRITILANPQELLGDGMATSLLTISATAADGVMLYSGNATLSSSLPIAFGTSKTNNETIAITNGAATETVSCDGKASSNCYGKVVIYGYLESNGAGQSGSVTVTFDAPDAGPVDAGYDAGPPKDAGSIDAGPDAGVFVPNAIVSMGVQPAFLGVDYQASYNVNPIGTFTFRVINTTADAGVGQIPVIFGLQTQTTAQLTMTNGVTDSAGNVQAFVQSGSAGSVLVTATATYDPDGGGADGGQTFSAQTSVNVIGTQPSAGNSSMSCTPQNLPVFAHGNLPCGQSSTQNLQTVCTARLGDRFGNSIGIAVPVVFYSEAGTWANSQVSTPAFGLPNPGLAVATLQTNKPLPQDVDPISGEPNYQDTCGGVPHTYNPRDGLVTVIAVFRGEEAFVVPPTTGVWAPGIEFTDLPQPFVDNDDSSVFGGSDVCPGNGGTGTCAPPNGTWDSNSSIYVETRILYTGSSNDLSVGAEPSSPTVFASTPIHVPSNGQYHGTVTFGDLNLNILTSSATQKVVLSVGPNSVQVSGELSGQGPVIGDQVQMQFPQLYQCDAGLTSEDGGAPVATKICTLKTVVNNMLGGFTGDYTASEGPSTNDGGIGICIRAISTVPPDLGRVYDFCGTAE